MFIKNEEGNLVNLDTCDYLGNFNNDYDKGEIDQLQDSDMNEIIPSIGLHARYGPKIVPIVTLTSLGGYMADVPDDWTDMDEDVLEIIEEFILEVPQKKIVYFEDIEKRLIEKHPDKGYISWLPSQRKKKVLDEVFDEIAADKESGSENSYFLEHGSPWINRQPA
ncbi:MAG: hypothetical protein ACLP51_05775 [Syntrophobacteraceae bacterium]